MSRTMLLALLPLCLAGLAAAATAAEDAKARFDALVAESWELDLRENPLLATAIGDHRFDDRLPSVAPADFERRASAARGQLARLAGDRPRPRSPPQDRVSYDMFERELRGRARRSTASAPGACRSRATAASTPISHACRRRCRSPPTRDYENYLARLRAFPRYFDQHVAQHARGPAHRLHAAARRARGLRRDDARPRRSTRRDERLLEAVRALPARRAGDRSRAAARGRARGDPRSVLPAYRPCSSS